MHAATELLDARTTITFDKQLTVSGDGVRIFDVAEAKKDQRVSRFAEKVDQGSVVYVAPRTNVALYYRVLDAAHEQVLFIFDEGSTVTLVEERLLKSDSIGNVAMVLRENACAHLFEIHQSDAVATHLKKHIHCERNSQLRREVIHIGGKTSMVDTGIALADDASADDVEVFFGNGEQVFIVNTGLYHTGLRSKGNILVKGLLQERAQFHSNAMLDIVPEAQRTDTFLAEHILVLSKDAKANVIPSLEIRANDVKASHAVSVSQIDHEQVFYLRTRGLDEREARKMIVQGFLGSALDTLSAHPKEQFHQLFEEKWK